MIAFVVKLGHQYVAYPNTWAGHRDEWTTNQSYAWRWVGLESGNGARLTARRIGNGARVVRLRSAPPPTPVSDLAPGSVTAAHAKGGVE